MNLEEKIASRYLCAKKLGVVVYEPYPNSPPDFLVDGRIAVEVRRLNQNEVIGSRNRGLEEVAIPLGEKLGKLLISLGPPVAGTSWFVTFWFRRPLTLGKPLRMALLRRLEAFLAGKEVGARIPISDNLWIWLDRAGSVQKHCFVMGGCWDRDEGGWLIPELQKNLEICIREKTRKIASVRKKYPEWWLVLIDRIAYGDLDDSDRATIRNWSQGKHDWDKIVLLSPQSATCELEIQNR